MASEGVFVQTVAKLTEVAESTRTLTFLFPLLLSKIQLPSIQLSALH